MRQSKPQAAARLVARPPEYPDIFTDEDLSAEQKDALDILSKIRQQAAERGLDRLTMAEIDAEIGAARRARGLNSKRGTNY